MEASNIKPGSNDSTETSDKHRGNWSSGIEFLLSCVSISVGLGNVWRFPNLAYQNGGGAFLIPYFILLFIVSKPLYYMELAFGQFSGKSAVKVWSCVPGFKGIGFAQLISTFYLTIFYNYIMAISLFYMFASMQNPLPWTVYNDTKRADNNTCLVNESFTLSVHSISNTTIMRPPSLGYFENYVLQIVDGLESISSIDWRMVLCLLLSWTIVTLSTVKGVKSLGKVVYLTATYPYIVLIALLCVSLTMDGAGSGLKYFFTPEWSKLADVKVWYKACEQSFFSLNIGFGHLIMYASYNKFNHPVHRDALIISIADTLTSVLAGSVVFSVLGVLATDLNVPVPEVAKDSGLRLAFVAYPEALGRLKTVPQLWSILFFIMMYMLGLGSSIGIVEAMMTTIKDQIPSLHKWKSVGAIACCVICFTCGLPLATNGGLYIMELLDNYGVGAAVFLYGIFEMVGISWIYGWRRFSNDVEFMLKTKVNMLWKITWSLIAPVTLIVVYVYGTLDMIINGTAASNLPAWGSALGWIFSAICISQIPIWFFIVVWKSPERGLLRKLRFAFRTQSDWGPSKPEDREQWLEWKQTNCAKSNTDLTFRHFWKRGKQKHADNENQYDNTAFNA